MSETLSPNPSTHQPQEKCQFPEEFPNWGVDQGMGRTFSLQKIGEGTRMKVYRSTDGNHVLRIPLLSEKELIRHTGGSGKMAAEGDPSSEISNDTMTDMTRYGKAKDYVGKNTVGVLPVYFPDQNGDWRTYSIQRFVKKQLDLRDLWLKADSLQPQEKRRIAKMIEDIREMIAETGLIFDLSGQGNVVLDENGFPKIIDVNMIQALVLNGEVVKPELKGVTSEEELITATRMGWNNQVNRFINPNFFSVNGYPIGDWSLQKLKRWETLLGIRTEKEVENDEIYSRYTSKLREEITRAIDSARFFTV